MLIDKEGGVNSASISPTQSRSSPSAPNPERPHLLSKEQCDFSLIGGPLQHSVSSLSEGKKKKKIFMSMKTKVCMWLKLDTEHCGGQLTENSNKQTCCCQQAGNKHQIDDKDKSLWQNEWPWRKSVICKIRQKGGGRNSLEVYDADSEAEDEMSTRSSPHTDEGHNPRRKRWRLWRGEHWVWMQLTS